MEKPAKKRPLDSKTREIHLLSGLNPVLVTNSELVVLISVKPLSVNPDTLLSTLVWEDGGGGGFESPSLSGIPKWERRSGYVCLFFWFNITFNNFSVISRQCLVVIWGLMLTFSATSLKYHTADTWHDIKPSHIIVRLGRPVLALSHKSECQARSSWYHFEWLWSFAAQDRTSDLSFPGVDTLPTELPCRCQIREVKNIQNERRLNKYVSQNFFHYFKCKACLRHSMFFFFSPLKQLKY